MTDAQKYTAELLGTLVVIFVGTTALVLTGANVFVSALAFGLSWAGMWWVFGHVSGGHFNPVITIATAVARRMNNKDVVPYIVCQALGGVIGSVLVWFILKGAPTAIGASPLATSLAAVDTTSWTITSLLLLELLFTTVLCLTWLAVTEKTTATGITGLGIGFAYTGVLLGGLMASWSAFNPVRTLGPAILANAPFAGIWVVWVGCIVGAVIGAAIWISVVRPARTTTTSGYTAEA